MLVQEALKILKKMQGKEIGRCIHFNMPVSKEAEAMQVAIAQMEKAIPRSPMQDGDDYKCPVCGTKNRRDEWCWILSVSRCTRCGQKLDWEWLNNSARRD